MHTFLDSKLMAKLLRQALAERNIDVSHSDSLELIARQFGCANWNILSARIEDANGAGEESLPKGWVKSGKSPRLYRAGVDRASNAAWIESLPEVAAAVREDDYCTLMQSVDAAAYRGKRLRLVAQLKTEAALGTGTVWLRIDGPSGSLRFENIHGHGDDSGPLTGSTAWQERSIVLDVPEASASLHDGFFVQGVGRCLCRGFRLGEVDDSVPLSTPEGRTLPRPTNLGFADLG